MTEITTKKDPKVLAAEIRYYQHQAQVMVLNYAIEIGRRLTEAKAVLKHGEWGEWLKNEVSFSQSSANNFMRIFERYGADQVSLFGDAKSQTLGNLPYTKALKLLAVPEDEVEEFIEENNVENMSTRELDKAIREREEAKKALEQEQQTTGALREELSAAEEAAARAKDEAVRLREELAELQNRPVEVAVEGPTPEMLEEIRAAEEKKFQEERAALQKRAADAEAKAQKQAEKVKSLKAQVEKAAETAKEEAKADVQAAHQVVAEAEKAKQAAEARAAELEKKLKMADNETAAFQVYFQSCQEDVSRMVGLIKKAGPDKAENLKRALAGLRDYISQQLG